MNRITMAHGSGGRIMHELVEKEIVPLLGMKGDLTDSAILDVCGGSRLAFTTDSYVVSPLFFPGGNIGDLAVNGTVNDLAVMGAAPKCLTVSFIIEEGFPLDRLRTIAQSISMAARTAEVQVVSGDTKVVEKGKGDGIFINTAGIGVLEGNTALHPSRIEAGDAVIISSPIGRHGVAVMAERNGLTFEPPVLSDTAPLSSLVEAMLSATDRIHAMRDPTRGGLATTLKEMALASGLGMMIYEDSIPVDDGVRGACELLGLDPLYVANEGVLVAFVPRDVAESLIHSMRQHPLGRGAAVIGEVTEERPGRVILRTSIGGSRMIDMLSGEQLPRIC